jgi:cell division protein FtsL
MIRFKLVGPFSSVVFTKQLAILLLLGFFVLTQAVGVIYSRQTRRLLHAKLQSLYALRDELQVEWSKLLLEQGTWQSDARVEKIAREQLGMITPDKTNVITP